MRVTSNDVRDDDTMFPKLEIGKTLHERFDLPGGLLGLQPIANHVPWKSATQGKVDTINNCRWCAHVAQYVIEHVLLSTPQLPFLLSDHLGEMPFH